MGVRGVRRWCAEVSAAHTTEIGIPPWVSWIGEGQEPQEVALPVSDPIFGRHYEAVSTGEIRRIRTGRALKPSRNQAGKLKVSFSADGNGRTAYLANEIYAAFVGPLPDGYIITHLNGDRADCRPQNLAAVTEEELRERQRAAATRMLLPPRWRGRIPGHLTDFGLSHGRTKCAPTCRVGHPLSMTGGDDGNTLTWGRGNRVCRVCSGLDLLAPLCAAYGYSRHYGVSAAPGTRQHRPHKTAGQAVLGYINP